MATAARPLGMTPPIARRLVIAAAVILAAAAVLVATLGQHGTTSAERAANQPIGKGPPYPGPPVSRLPPTLLLPVGEQGQVYAEVIQAIAKDSGTTKWPVLFVLEATRAEDPGGTFTAERGTSIDPRTRTAIRTQMPTVRWISEPIQAKPDGRECGEVERHGLIVTLGEIRDRAGQLQVRASGWFGCDGAAWLTYKLDRQGSDWRISGTTGPAVVA